AWDNPSPCEGWAARDVVRHMVETASFFLGRAGGELQAPSADDDPVGAWFAARDAIQAALDDPALAAQEYDTPMGRSTLERTVGMFGIGDVLVHTWDLARATGQDDRLDPDEVHRLLEAMEPHEAMMRSSGSFGPPVEVPDDADEQDKLIAFTGRRP
ncbi:MAG: TIGR03086 family metal-binding protein, partial [Actinomycetota bacterium]|nr:TIGR03086 family metal-binding protein [Actinomycetota bacterium]